MKTKYKNKTSPDLMGWRIRKNEFGSQMKDIKLKGRKITVSSLNGGYSLDSEMQS